MLRQHRVIFNYYYCVLKNIKTYTNSIKIVCYIATYIQYITNICCLETSSNKIFIRKKKNITIYYFEAQFKK